MVKRLPVTASSSAVVLQMARSRTIVRYWGTSDCPILSLNLIVPKDTIDSNTTQKANRRGYGFMQWIKQERKTASSKFKYPNQDYDKNTKQLFWQLFVKHCLITWVRETRIVTRRVVWCSYHSPDLDIWALNWQFSLCDTITRHDEHSQHAEPPPPSHSTSSWRDTGSYETRLVDFCQFVGSFNRVP